MALSQAATNAGVPYRTAQRWLAQYQRLGLAGLARRPRTDRDTRRRLSPELLHLVEGLALQKPPLGPAAIHREVVKLAEQRGEKPPSYSLVYSVVRNLSPALTTLAHQGEKVYRVPSIWCIGEKQKRKRRSSAADMQFLEWWARNLTSSAGIEKPESMAENSTLAA